jgi:hypothetical protein
MSLKDLIRHGPPPRPRQKRQPSIIPIQVDSVTWFYPMPKGIAIVHEVRVKDRYIRTDQFTIKWVDVNTAIEWRKMLKKAARLQPAIAAAR